MTSRLVPKEQLPDFQRWDIGSFNRPKPEPQHEVVKLPTAAEVEAIQQQAYDEGYRTGIREAQAETQTLRQMAHTITQIAASAESGIAEDIFNLALKVATQVIRESLKVKPELVIPVIREAMAAITGPQQNPALILNPADVALVKKHLGDLLSADGWKIIGDEQIQSGGCRVEWANGETDATLATRWQRVISTLGSNHAWLDE